MNRIKVIVCLALGVIATPLHSVGYITVRSSEMGAHVMIDEMVPMRVSGHEQCFAVEEGLHLVIVDKEGYYPYTDTISVAANDNLFMPAWLEPMSKKAKQSTTPYKQLTWRYQLANGVNSLRWVGVGGGLGTGLNVHVSFFDFRFGLFTLEPCVWGMNIPFITGVTHLSQTWLVHPRDRRSGEWQYEVAIPSTSLQFYYTPMLGVVFPLQDQLAFTLSAGPQISWTRIEWLHALRDLPTTYPYEFTNEPFPTTGFYFDPVWFSVQIGVLFNGHKTDALTYFKYQDGYFIGVDFRF